jgi:hypothetical protein
MENTCRYINSAYLGIFLYLTVHDSTDNTDKTADENTRECFTFSGKLSTET